MPDPNDPVAEAKNEIAELKEKEKTFSEHIDVLIDCSASEKFADENLGVTKKYFTTLPPQKSEVLLQIADLKYYLKVLPLLSTPILILSVQHDPFATCVCRVELFVVSIHLTFELSHYMWLYCLCGGGNFLR